MIALVISDCVLLRDTTWTICAAEPAGWKAGLARESITPQTEVWLAGYAGRRAPTGSEHEMWMKALALEDHQGRRAVLVTSDFQGVPKSMSDRVFERVKDRYGLERQDLMITFSHNHCGPRLGDDLLDYYPVDEAQEKLVAEYTDLMVEKMSDMIGRSLADLAPANLEYGEGRATFAVNRRNNREADVPQLMAAGTPLAGPVDHAVPVLKVTRVDGRESAIIFGYACHPTTLNFKFWCGDYPGFAQLEIEQAHPGTMAMFVNTCGGDQNPLPRRTLELCQKYGHQLAVGVEEGLQGELVPVSPSLRTGFKMIELPYFKAPSVEELKENSHGTNPILARWAQRMLKRLEAGEPLEQSYPYPVHVWQLGTQVLWIGQGGETVVDYALRFKAEYGRGTWVLGYVDDMVAYIPSHRVWQEGGYEGGSRIYEYGRHAYRWSGEVENLIAAAVDQLVAEVHQNPPQARDPGK